MRPSAHGGSKRLRLSRAFCVLGAAGGFNAICASSRGLGGLPGPIVSLMETTAATRWILAGFKWSKTEQRWLATLNINKLKWSHFSASSVHLLKVSTIPAFTNGKKMDVLHQRGLCVTHTRMLVALSAAITLNSLPTTKQWVLSQVLPIYAFKSN